MEKEYLYFDCGDFEVKIPFKLSADATEITADLTNLEVVNYG